MKILITGASRGIGLEMVRYGLDQGWDVADEWRLEEGSGSAPADHVPGGGHSPDSEQDQPV